MAWHLWGQGSISHHPTLGGTEKMLSWPNLPYAVLDKHSSNVAGYHEVAKMRFEYLWLVRIKKIEDAVGVLSVHQYNEQRWGQVMLRLNKSIQFWSCISTVYAQTRDACISPTGAAIYGFPGNPSSIKMARVGRGSDEDQQQCPCAEKIKTCSSRFADRQPTGKQPTPPSSPSSQKKIDQLLVPTSPISPWSFLKLLGAPSHWLTCCICKMPSSPTWILALTSAWNLCQI